MNKLFIYYSMTGNGDVVSEYFNEKGYNIIKVESTFKYPENTFLLMMIGGFKALFNRKDELLPFNTDISKYDEIVIGSPVWFDRLSAPINAVLDTLELSNKNISFVLYSASGEASKATERINKLYNADISVLKEPKKYKEELSKVTKVTL